MSKGNPGPLMIRGIDLGTPVRIDQHRPAQEWTCVPTLATRCCGWACRREWFPPMTACNWRWRADV